MKAGSRLNKSFMHAPCLILWFLDLYDSVVFVDAFASLDNSMFKDTFSKTFWVSLSADMA